MKKYFGIIISIYIFTLSVLVLVLPKKDFSENENRKLAVLTAPSIENIANGKFNKNVEEYLQDHFAFRSFFLNLKTSMEIAMRKTENNNVYICSNNYLIEKTADADYSKLQRISKALNMLSASTNAQCFMLLAPTSISVNQDKLPRYATYTHEDELISYIYDKLENYSVVYTLDALKENNKNYQMYYMLDHHWTTLGAYTAFMEFAKNANIDATPIDNISLETVSTSFLGTVHSKANIKNVVPDTIDIYTNPTSDLKITYFDNSLICDWLYNKEYLNKKDQYSMFLDNNQSQILIENTNIANDSNILVIKDSYANCFVPFLTDYYNKTHVIDLRYFNKNIYDYIRDNDIKNILVLYNIKTIQNDVDIFKLVQD